MQQVQNIDYIDRLSIILKLIKYREDNYFKLTDFIKRNIDGMKNQTQQVSIVNLFLKKIQDRQNELIQEEQVLINQYKGITIKSQKFILRLTARIFEIFQGSLLRIKGTLFYDAKVQGIFKEFQYRISQNILVDEISLKQLIFIIFEYSKSKYINQLNKINKFLQRLEDGQRIKLKQFYENYNEQEEIKREIINKQNPIQEKSPKKRKFSKESKKSKQKCKDRKQTNQKSPEKSQIKKQNKTNIVNKMMKIYSVIDPSRLQFVQDFIYENQSQQQQKITNTLLQKNKEISQQISEYYNRTQLMVQNIQSLIINQPKSNYEMQIEIMERQFHKINNLKSQSNIKSNFIISKQKKLIKNSFFKNLKDYDGPIMQTSQFISNSTIGQYSSGNQYLSDTDGTLIIKTERQKKTKFHPTRSRILVKTKVFPNLTIPQKTHLFTYFDEQMIGRNTLSSNKNKRTIIQKVSTVSQDECGILMNLSRPIKTNTKLFDTKHKKELYAKKLGSSTPANKQKKESNLNKQLMISNFNNKQQLCGTVSQGKKSMQNDNTITVSSNNKKEFNLRLKKQNKKNIFNNEKLFVSEKKVNEQINNYNFPQPQ